MNIKEKVRAIFCVDLFDNLLPLYTHFINKFSPVFNNFKLLITLGVSAVVVAVTLLFLVHFYTRSFGSSCAIKIDDKCFSVPFMPIPMTKAECEAAVAKGELGIKSCYFDVDYWAGAVKSCGGVENMPTLSDLAKLASIIYEDAPIVGTYTDKAGLTYKSGKATSLGLPEPTFYLWSGEEDSGYGACIRGYNPSHSYWGNSVRYSDIRFVICMDRK